MKNKKIILWLYLVLAVFCVSALSACDALGAFFGGEEETTEEATDETTSEDTSEDEASDGEYTETETEPVEEEAPEEVDSSKVINVGTVVTGGPWYATVDLIEVSDTVSVGISPSFSQNGSGGNDSQTQDNASGDAGVASGDTNEASSSGDTAQPTEPAEGSQQPESTQGGGESTPQATPSVPDESLDSSQDELARWAMPFGFRNLIHQVDNEDELATDDELSVDEPLVGSDDTSSADLPETGGGLSARGQGQSSTSGEADALGNEDNFADDSVVTEDESGIVDESLDQSVVDASSSVIPYGTMAYDGTGIDIADYEDAFKVACKLDIVGVVDTEAQGTFTITYNGQDPISYVVNLVLSDDMKTMEMTCDTNPDLSSVLWIEDETKAKLTVPTKMIFSGIQLDDANVLPEEDYLDLTLAESAIEADECALAIDVLSGNIDFVIPPEDSGASEAVSRVTNTSAINGYALVYDEDQAKWYWMSEEDIKEMQNTPAKDES